MARKKYSEAERKLMETMGYNLKRVLKEKKMTQIEFSEKSGIPNSTVSDYVKGKTLISPGILDKIADLLDVPKSSLTSTVKDNSKDNVSYYPVYDTIVSLPIVGKISCGNGEIALQEIEGYEPTPKNWVTGGKYFYLRAKGDSMEGARIKDGDLLLIRQQEDIENGEIAAVYMDGEARLKRVYMQNGSMILQSENPKYSPVVLESGDVRIIGKLEKLVVTY